MNTVEWFSCRRFTIKVVVAPDGTIQDAAPIARKFIGQPVGKLVDWMSKIGGFKYAHLR